MGCPSWAPERGHVLRRLSWRSGLFGVAGAERGDDLNELVPWVLARKDGREGESPVTESPLLERTLNVGHATERNALSVFAFKRR